MLQPHLRRRIRPQDTKHTDTVAQGTPDEKLPWWGFLEADVAQDLLPHWKIDSRHKAEWLAYLMTSGGQYPIEHRYYAYMELPDGPDKEASRTSLLTDLTHTWEGLVDAVTDFPDPLVGVNPWIYCARDLSGLDDPLVAFLREEIRKALDDPEYTIITNFEFYGFELHRGHHLWATDADDAQTEALRKEVAAAWDDPDHIAVLPFDVCSAPVRDRKLCCPLEQLQAVQAELDNERRGHVETLSLMEVIQRKLDEALQQLAEKA